MSADLGSLGVGEACYSVGRTIDPETLKGVAGEGDGAWPICYATDERPPHASCRDRGEPG